MRPEPQEAKSDVIATSPPFELTRLPAQLGMYPRSDEAKRRGAPKGRSILKDGKVPRIGAITNRRGPRSYATGFGVRFHSYHPLPQSRRILCTIQQEPAPRRISHCLLRSKGVRSTDAG